MRNKKLKLKGNLGRQGDVFVQKISDLPEGLKELKQDLRYKGFVLAYGEVSGHAHVIDPKKDSVKYFSDDKGAVFLKIEKQTSLDHKEKSLEWTKEHFSFGLEPGLYEVTGQREYSPEEIRRVSD